MKKRAFFAFFLAFLLQFCLVNTAAQTEFDGYIVRMADDAPALFSLDEPEGMEYLIPGFCKVDDYALVEELLASGLAAYAEPNYILELYDYELYETEIDTSKSWTDVIVRADYAADLGLAGEGVRIAVIDTGLDATNPNLAGANIAPGYDYVTGSGETMSDPRGHGTYVAQMIVGIGKFDAVRGIAPKATIVPLRCFGADGKSQTAHLLQAIVDAVRVYDCDVVNMSWGFTVEPKGLAEAIGVLTDAGAVAVVAAGNVSSTMPQGTLSYPAAYEQTVGVGNVDSELVITPSSQQTAAVDVCAPGDSIRFIKDSTHYAISGGTSFAAPAVSAMAALLREAQPQLDTAALRSLIVERAIDLGESGYDTAYGYGFMRMDKMLGQSWTYAMKSRIIGWLRNDGSTLIKASYGEGGKMLGSSFARAAKSLETIAANFDKNETAAFFLLGSDGTPMRAAIRTK